MVAERRPEHGLSKYARIGIENRRLKLSVGAVLVRVIAEHEPQIGMDPAGKR